MANNTEQITGVVLAGGLSSRLGSDKARLELYKDEDLLSRSARLLLEIVPKVLVVGRSGSQAAPLAGLEFIEDERPGCGPAGGIATALRHSGTDCLVLSCDLPFMTGDLLEKLLCSWKKRRPDTLLCAYMQEGTGKLENLVGVYSHAALPCLDKSLEKKLLKISRILPPERQEAVPYSFDEALPFFNINYPADLLLAQEYLRLKQ